MKNGGDSHCSKTYIISGKDEKFFEVPVWFFKKPNRSTEDAVAATHIFINDALDDDCLAATLFFDIKKAFDTLNHQLLFKKLKNTGIRGVPL